MLEHHLTIVQLKSVFISDKPEAIVIHDGLHPYDAERYGLQPLVAVTVSVRKMGLHWQKVFRAGQPIPLGRALFEAWSGAAQLRGMPDVLHIDPQFPASFPLRPFLTELHGMGRAPEICMAGDRSFGSSKREAQKLLSKYIDWGDMVGKENEAIQIQDTEALLAKMNSNLAAKLGFWSVEDLSISSSESPQKRLDYMRLLQRQVTKPVEPSGWPDLEAEAVQETKAFYSQAYDVEEKPNHLDLVIYHEESWIKWLRVGIANGSEAVITVPYDDRWLGPMRDEGYQWKDEYPEFVSTLQSLPFPPVQVFPDVVRESNVEGFLTGREPMPLGYVQAVLEKMREESYVFRPRNLQALIHTFENSSGGGDIDWAFELVARQSTDTAYRYFAYDSDWCPTHLLVVSKHIPLTKKNTPSAMFSLFGEYLDELNVGAQALAILEHQFTHHVLNGDIQASRDFMAMLKTMLEAWPKRESRRN